VKLRTRLGWFVVGSAASATFALLGPAIAQEPSAKASAAVEALLAPPKDGGDDVVGDAGRAYFAGLPEHARARIADAVEQEIITSPVQLAAIHTLELPTQRLELLLSDNCALCHMNPGFHGPDTLFSIDPAAAGSPSHMSIVDYVADVHFRHNLSCAGCHGGDPTGYMAHDFPPEWPTDADARHDDRKWIPAFCARCHSDAAYMRRFDPSLPTDQLAKYRTSDHGKLLLEEDDSRAA